MIDLQKLLETKSDENVIRDIKLALYLYKDLLTNNNEELLNEYTKIIIDIFKTKNGSIKEKSFLDDIEERFYYYVIKKGKTENTAYDYVKRVERICKEYGITVAALFNRKSSYSINDLIGMYSRNGIKSEENIKKHNAPLSALRQFRDFMDGLDNLEDETDAYNLYLCDTEGYQSFEIMSKHPYIIEIKGRKCEITFKENRVICDRVSKIINDKNYHELVNVFKKYNNILSRSKMTSIQSFPFGGNHSYKYNFGRKANYSGCATLFESNDRKIVEQAYAEYHRCLEKIIGQ